MRRVSRHAPLVTAGAIAVAAASCTSDGVSVDQDPPGPERIVVNFSIDDSANQTYAEADGLAWKGSFSYDPGTNLLVQDAGWAGPYPLLHDDGPTDAGGHEPIGSVAGDHIWGVAVETEVPEGGSDDFEYGAIRGSVDGSDGDWIWHGTNGTFSVAVGRATPVDAAGLLIEAFGTIDLRLTLDVNALDPAFGAFTSAADNVAVKSSAWDWLEILATDDGIAGPAEAPAQDIVVADGIYTFILSTRVGPGTSFPHNGLLPFGSLPEFIFVLEGVEYRIGVVAATGGVSAYTRARGDPWSESTIEANDDGNTYVVAPAFPTQPAGTVPVSFTIDDSANQTYGLVSLATNPPIPTESGVTELYWKGSFHYDRATRVLSHDPTWGGGSLDITIGGVDQGDASYPPLYDDGPRSLGGHEPEGATAGDHIWGITAFVEVPPTDPEVFEFGACQLPCSASEGWIWTGVNGSFTVRLDTVEEITRDALIDLFGEVDLRLELDVSALDPAFAGFIPDEDNVTVKGSRWGWASVELSDDATGGDVTAGDGIYTFTLGENLGDLRHAGLLGRGDTPEFVFQLDGVDYQVGGVAADAGVSAFLFVPQDGFWSQIPVEHEEDDGDLLSDLAISVPAIP